MPRFRWDFLLVSAQWSVVVNPLLPSVQDCIFHLTQISLLLSIATLKNKETKIFDSHEINIFTMIGKRVNITQFAEERKI